MRNMTLTGSALKSAYNDVLRYRVYGGGADTGAASLFSTDPVVLFTQGQGTVSKNVTTGADVTLRQCDTSLFNSNGIIPNSQSFEVMAIGIDIHLANVQGNVPFEDDTITQIDVNPVQTVNPYPLVEYIRNQGVFTLRRNSTEFLEQGNISDYPCGLYNSGWGSDGSASVDIDADYHVDGFIMAQNGMAFRELTVHHVLSQLDQFQGQFQMSRPALLTGTGLVIDIDFLLVGQANVDQQSQQYLAG